MSTTLLYFLNPLLMLVLPIAAAIVIDRKRNPGWGLFAAGAVTFILSQVAHIPFNWLILQKWQLLPNDTDKWGGLLIMALFLGLSAGLFEETARLLAYRFWVRNGRTWGRGLMLGIGHGGIESILLGIIVGANYYVLARISGGGLLHLVPDGQLPLVQAQIEALFEAPLPLAMLGAVERVFAICFHLSASLLVMQVYLRRQKRWYVAAVFLHTVFNAAAVIAAARWNPYAAEAVVGIMALVSLYIILRLRQAEPTEMAQEPLPELEPPALVQLDLTDELLEKSRYQ